MYIENCAIADCLRHKRLGVVSYQPLYDPSDIEKISIMDNTGKHHLVRPIDCVDDVTEKEIGDYWKTINDRP